LKEEQDVGEPNLYNIPLQTCSGVLFRTPLPRMLIHVQAGQWNKSLANKYRDNKNIGMRVYNIIGLFDSALDYNQPSYELNVGFGGGGFLLVLPNVYLTKTKSGTQWHMTTFTLSQARRHTSAS
jgi:hypothetical protein